MEGGWLVTIDSEAVWDVSKNHAAILTEKQFKVGHPLVEIR